MDALALALIWAPLSGFILGQVVGYTTQRWWSGLLIGLALATGLMLALPLAIREQLWPPIYLLTGLLGSGTGRSFRRLHTHEASGEPLEPYRRHGLGRDVLD